MEVESFGSRPAITFNTAVTGVDASDFQLALSGVSAFTPVVNGSGSVYTVTVNGVSGVGRVRCLPPGNRAAAD